jgi:hypothetical protein
MLKAIGVFLICGAAFPAHSQSGSPDKVGAFTAQTQSAPSNNGQSSNPGTAVPQQQTPIKSTEVIGLGGVKNKTAGILSIEDGKLGFVHSRTESEIPAAAMEDVVTAADSQRAIRGTLGTMSMLAPYGSGRVLSMFRSKVDSLTIKYRDDNGGLHGAIFVMPPGTAEPFKQALIKEGARTTIPAPATTPAPSTTPAPATTSADASYQLAARGQQ